MYLLNYHISHLISHFLILYQILLNEIDQWEKCHTGNWDVVGMNLLSGHTGPFVCTFVNLAAQKNLV